MVPLRLEHWVEAKPVKKLSAGSMGFLNYLRFTSMSCRAKPRTDLFQACALLQVEKSASQEAHADALMRCLSEALGKPVRFLAPGTSELTFDESWLVQLGIATAQDDHASISFLMNSRVAHEIGRAHV